MRITIRIDLRLPLIRLRLAPPLLLLLAMLLLVSAQGEAAPIAVSFPEATVRGFLLLNSREGALLASGDFLQTKQGAEVETRTVFHFKDGSLYDERVVFTEDGSFAMKNYRLVQKGPAFGQDLTASIDRASGKCRVVTKGHKDREEKVYEDKLDLPFDTYNGMIPVVAKSLRSGGRERVHMVAFTPSPRLIGLDFIPSGENRVTVGGLEKTVTHWILKPQLGLGLKIGATLLGRLPPDNHLWMITTEVPAFIRFQGPLYTDGPIWQIELTSPRWVR